MTESSNREPEVRPPRKNVFASFVGKFPHSSKDSGRGEQEEAEGAANWALLKFISAQVQLPERSVYPNKYNENVTVAELAQKDVTILRVKGSMRYRPENHFWFLIVKKPQRFYTFGVGTGGREMENLEPTLRGYKVGLIKKHSREEAHQPVKIEFFLNSIGNYPEDHEYADAEKIDVMFGGTPELEPKPKQELTELVPARQRVKV